jgi:prevent-host-death family protein
VKVATVAEVKAQFSAYLKESEQGLVIVTRNGKPVAALVAVQDDEELERLILAHSARLRELLGTARQHIREGQGIGHEDFWREIEDEKPGKSPSRRTARSSAKS